MSVIWTPESKGCTVWFTGLSGSGKTTVSRAVRDNLLKFNVPVKNLDGDELRLGLNSNLGFSRDDRGENIRRSAEIASEFAKSGFITLVSIISPYAEFRRAARAIHENDRKNVKFFEAYVNTPIEVCEKNDVKGLYKKARTGQLADFTGVSMEYEVPTNPDLLIERDKYSLEECVIQVIQLLVNQHFLPRAIIELIDPRLQLATNDCLDGYEQLPKIEISRSSLEWTQILAEGWACPLDGFMNENELLECIQFKTITKDNMKHSQSIPIVLPVTDEDRQLIGDSKSVCLDYTGKSMAILTDIQIYANRKKERCARTFASLDVNHPTIGNIISNEGNWCIGGKLHLINQIIWQDGLDKYRLTPAEIKAKLKEMQADAVFIFQLRNPLHNGHILLINETRRQLKEKHINPVLLLHPIGGWTKDDDVPLSVRMNQYQILIDEGILDEGSTILSIFPSPMLYAGPTEVLWHAKARLVAGINYYIVGRDPAGIKDPSNPDEDLYDPFDGAKVLQMAQGLKDNLQILDFKMAALDKKVNKMTFFDPSRKEDFELISGSRMRQMARDNETPPEQFMLPAAWKVLADHYRSLTK